MRKIRKFMFIILFFSIIILFNITCFASAGNGFSKFDCAPRFNFDFDDKKNLVIKIKDFSGIEKDNIHIYLNDSKGQELTNGHGLESFECIENQETTNGKIPVKYECLISNKTLKKYISNNRYQKFYIKIKDNFGNYNNAYFIINIKKNNSDFFRDAAPRISKLKTDGKNFNFSVTDFGGVSILKVFDLNNKIC